MPRSAAFARLAVFSLLILSLLLSACSNSSDGSVLTLPTGAATTSAAATTAPAATKGNIATTVAQATPVAQVTVAATTTAPKLTTVAATPTPRPAIKPLTGFAGKIGLIGAENALYVSRFDGKEPQAVVGKPGLHVSDTQDGPLYAWPTWSRDGSRLAVAALNFKAGAVESSDVYIVGQDGQNLFKLQDKSPDRPIFMSWSPDGNQFSELVSVGGTGLELRLFDVSKGAVAAQTVRKVTQAQAVYTGWSPDSQQLLIHTTNPNSDSLAVLATKDPKAQPTPLKVTPTAFRTASYSADGSRLAYAVLNAKSGYEDVFVQDKAGAVLGHIETQGRGASFSWSPGGQRLAHSYLLPDSQGALSKGIAVTDTGAKAGTDGKLAATQVVNDSVISYFWSPDGKKLAYITFNDTGKMLIWKTYDFDTQKATQLAEWYPSDDTVQLLQYFDQYALGNSVWSPDSKALVFAGFTKEDVDTLTQSGNANADPTIYVLPVDGAQAGKAVPVGVGKLAFWSK